MKPSSVIKLVTHPHAFETLQSRIDFAQISGRGMVENPWWYEDTRTGRTFYDLAACIGWPDKITAEHGEGQAGYIAIVGIVRPRDAEETRYDARQAAFLILEEYQHLDVPTLLQQCVTLRKKYGFGINRGLLNVWWGDPNRFETALALTNESLIKHGGEDAAVMIVEPDDYTLSNYFEIYLRALKGVQTHDNLRLYLGEKQPGETGDTRVLIHRLREFKRDDPAVTAIGGLVHTLLMRTLWMRHIDNDNYFYLDEAI